VRLHLGIAKDFEVIDNPRRVIVLEDDEKIREYDEDWEDIYIEEEPHIARRTYSAVLSGNDRR
jgi:hypothetical protein